MFKNIWFIIALIASIFCISYLAYVWIHTGLSFHKKQQEEIEVSLNEDLMREHGVLRRTLLIYDECIKRIEAKSEIPVAALHESATIIKTFIEDYHEKLEENYIFPIFEKHNVETKLVKTLKLQHDKGRAITAQILQLTKPEQSIDQSIKPLVTHLLRQFIRMYRPHAAREDTILFPQIHSLLSKHEFEELGDQFEDLEHKLFGAHGFETTVKKIEAIEKELSIYELEQFTPTHN